MTLPIWFTSITYKVYKRTTIASTELYVVGTLLLAKISRSLKQWNKIKNKERNKEKE